MSDSMVGRRRLLQGVAGTVAGAVSASLLVGCDSGGDDSATSGQTSDVKSTAAGPTASGATPAATSGGASSGPAKSGLPVRVPRVVAEPDLPALDNGAPAGYLAYPASPKRLYDSPPANGGTISFFKQGDTPLPAPMNKNPWWQELNKRVGATMEITQTIGSDYDAKLATTVAGGDLLDYVQMPYSWPHLPELLEAKFQDLSPWLAGDAIKQFPSLASLPTYGWQSVALNGGLWGVPWSFSSTAGSENRCRQDILDSVGFDGELSDGEDFLAMCKEVTDVKRNRWALADMQRTTLAMVEEMVGAPNVWRVEDGKFIRSFETDEYKRALDLTNQIRKAGYISPAADTASTRLPFFYNGGIVIYRLPYTNWASLAAAGAQTDPKFMQGGLVLPKWDGGGQAGHFESSGVFTFTALKKASDDRVKELLTVLDWFAAPIGSEEYLFVKHGIPGRDYTLKGTDPVETETGITEVRHMAASYYATDPSPLYIAGQPEQTKAQYQELSKLMDATVPLPTVGLFSDTQLSTGATIDKNMASLESDIIHGRKPVSALDAGVKAWRSGGGDKIRDEYEKSYAQAH